MKCLLLCFLLVGCATLDRPLPIDPVGEAQANVRTLAGEAANIYIERKNGETDYLHSIAQGIRAYKGIVNSYESFKLVIAKFSDGKKEGKGLVERLANLFATNPTPATAESLAVAVETQAMTTEFSK